MLEKNWMTVQQAAEALGYTVQHVRLLARKNEIQHAFVGPRMMVLEKNSVILFGKNQKNIGRPRSGQKKT